MKSQTKLHKQIGNTWNVYKKRGIVKWRDLPQGCRSAGRETLPGRTGVYDRFRCNEQILIDEANVEAVDNEGKEAVLRRVKYCRRCEIACPIGSGNG